MSASCSSCSSARTLPPVAHQASAKPAEPAASHPPRVATDQAQISQAALALLAQEQGRSAR